MIEEAFERLEQRQSLSAANHNQLREAAQAIRDDFFQEQRDLEADPAKMKSLLAPRQSGKTRADDMSVFAKLLDKPNRRALIVCLTLKQCREAHWMTFQDLAREYMEPRGIEVDFHESDLRFTLPNGSRCVLVGAETREKIERLRGPQDDIIILDEPGSFSADTLEYLIFDILFARLISRDGELWLTGTPGLYAKGAFYRATALEDANNFHKGPDGKSTGVPYAMRYKKGIETPEECWSFHTWTLAHNTKTGGWKRALALKKLRGWADDHPSWRREYLAHWVSDIDGLVYAFSTLRHTGKVTWEPDYSTKDLVANHGLPLDGDWHYALGMDFGLVDATAFVVLAHSRVYGEARVVYEFKASDMLPKDVAERIKLIQAEFPIENMVGDHGGFGGKTYLLELQRQYGITIEHAQKHDKNDFILLLNSDFHEGRVKLRHDGELAYEMDNLSWDLAKDTKTNLSRANRLKEDAKYDNHLCDALLYVWRFSLHRWRTELEKPPEPGTPAHDRLMDTYAAARAVLRRARKRAGDFDNDFQGEDPWMETAYDLS